MAAKGRIIWDADGERKKGEGTDRGVLYVVKDSKYGDGVAWNGLTQVTLSPDGAEASDLWADNIKYLTLYSAESFGFTIEAFWSPEEFDECDGMAEAAPGVGLGQQSRKTFGFSYRSGITNDTVGEDYGYKIHLIYGAKASPSEVTDQTKSDSPNTDTLSWECSTTPVKVTKIDADGKEYKPVSHIELDSTKINNSKLKAFEDILYGTDAIEADATAGTEAKDAAAGRLPLPDEVIEFFKTAG